MIKRNLEDFGADLFQGVDPKIDAILEDLKIENE